MAMLKREKIQDILLSQLQINIVLATMSLYFVVNNAEYPPEKSALVDYCILVFIYSVPFFVLDLFIFPWILLST